MAKKKASKKKATRTKKKATKKKPTQKKSKATPKRKAPAKRANSARAEKRDNSEYEGWETFTAKQRQVIKAFEHIPKPTQACLQVGFSRGTFYSLLKTKPLFAKAIKRAEEISVENAEAVAMQLGVLGRDELQISNGQVVMSMYDESGEPYGTDENGNPITKPLVRRVHDVGLLKFVLAAKKPEEYGRKRMEHTGKDGKPIQQESSLVILNEKATGELSDEMLEHAASQAETPD